MRSLFMIIMFVAIGYVIGARNPGYAQQAGLA